MAFMQMLFDVAISFVYVYYPEHPITRPTINSSEFVSNSSKFAEIESESVVWLLGWGMVGSLSKTIKLFTAFINYPNKLSSENVGVPGFIISWLNLCYSSISFSKCFR